jgi:hypothetical protein
MLTKQEEKTENLHKETTTLQDGLLDEIREEVKGMRRRNSTNQIELRKELFSTFKIDELMN